MIMIMIMIMIIRPGSHLRQTFEMSYDFYQQSSFKTCPRQY